jgi:hypothetical protein
MLVKDYVASATKSEGPFLSMMNLSPATVYSEPRRDAKRFFEQIFARRVDGPSRVERWRSPQRVAHRTLFCDDLVYIEGGRPVYFGVRRGTPNDPMLSLEVGSAEAEHFHLASRYFPGPLFKERRDAACRSLVYGIESIGDEIDVLRRNGVLVTFASKAEVHIEFRSDRDACEICADALVRRAVAAMDPLLLRELGEMLQRELRAGALSFQRIPSALCRDAIHAMTATSPEGEFFGRFGVEFEWAAEALSRLDAMHMPMIFSELDDQALVAVSNSALRA